MATTSSEVERIILRAIEGYARGNPEALARDIIAALTRAGFVIVPDQTGEPSSGTVLKKERRRLR